MHYPQCKVERVEKREMIRLLGDTAADHLWVNSEFLASLRKCGRPQKRPGVSPKIQTECNQIIRHLLLCRDVSRDSLVMAMVLETLEQAKGSAFQSNYWSVITPRQKKKNHDARTNDDHHCNQTALVSSPIAPPTIAHQDRQFGSVTLKTTVAVPSSRRSDKSNRKSVCEKDEGIEMQARNNGDDHQVTQMPTPIVAHLGQLLEPVSPETAMETPNSKERTDEQDKGTEMQATTDDGDRQVSRISSPTTPSIAGHPNQHLEASSSGTAITSSNSRKSNEDRKTLQKVNGGKNALPIESEDKKPESMAKGGEQVADEPANRPKTGNGKSRSKQPPSKRQARKTQNSWMEDSGESRAESPASPVDAPMEWNDSPVDESEPAKATDQANGQPADRSGTQAKRGQRHLRGHGTSENEAAVAATPIESLSNEEANKAKPDQARKRKRDQVPKMLRALASFTKPGISEVSHRPNRYGNQVMRDIDSKRIQRECLDELAFCLPEHCEEIFRKGKKPPKQRRTNHFKFNPERLDCGYFKVHVSAEFANHFGDCLPKDLHIKPSVSLKAIAFVSTRNTQCCTHYDNDTSFLLVLAGRKEIKFAPPKHASKLRLMNVVQSNSSLFEDLDPFGKDSTPEWESLSLKAGDGLLLPKGWIHVVRSFPGTVAVSIQVAYIPKSRKTRANAATCPGIAALLSEKQTSPATAKRQKTANVAEASAKDSAPKAAPKATPKATKATPTDAPTESDSFSRCLDVPPPPPPMRTSLPLIKGQETTPTTDSGVRRSRRLRFYCGTEGCGSSFPCNGTMWVLMLEKKDDDEESSDDDSCAGLPIVANHPKHLICHQCMPVGGRQIVKAALQLNKADREAIPQWHRYVYYASSKIDYERWALYSGSSGIWDIKS